MRVDPSNADQLTAWDGDGGDFWTRNARRFDQGIAAYHGTLLDAAAIEPTSRVLDIGCGSGQTTRDAARRASGGEALGLDLSGPMLELARRLTAEEGIGNATYAQADAQTHPFGPGEFDRALSRNGVMFFGDPEAAWANIARAVRPGGRLALLVWQPAELNEWMPWRRASQVLGREVPGPPPDGPGPMALSAPERVHGLLEPAGFTDVRLTDLRRPMYLGTDAEDAYPFVSGQIDPWIRDLEPAERERALANLRADLAEHAGDQGVRYDSAAWLIEARRAG